MVRLFFSTLIKLRLSALFERLAVKLSPAQMTVLYVLYEASHDRVSIGRVAEELGVSPAAVTGLADRLQRDEFVTRRPDDADRRIVLVSLTDAGRQAVEELIAAFKDLFRPLVVEMSPESRESVAQVLEQIYELARRLTGPPEVVDRPSS